MVIKDEYRDIPLSDDEPSNAISTETGTVCPPNPAEGGEARDSEDPE
ncbi:MAG: hypothetical protein LBT26_02485 [Clostridiales Family XIII bacterium]|jgi:hypothetical protein|nr:hypothetical protein [Clostridiales Family XIII bacterium]